jgi:death-on-curing protein
LTEGTSLDAAHLVEIVAGHVLPTARLAALFHGIQLRRFGGAPGLRDSGLLESAVARGAQMLVYSETGDIIEAACAIAEGIVRNHPFVDGNKRTAFACIASTLAVNGYRLEMEPIDAAQAMVDLAVKRLTAEEFRALVRAHAVPVPASDLTKEHPTTGETGFGP